MEFNKSTLVFALTLFCFLPGVASSEAYIESETDEQLFAEDNPSFFDIFLEGKFAFKARLRHAHIEEDDFNQGDLTTLLTRGSFHTGAYKGFDAFIELDNVNILSDDNMNTTSNGKTDFPPEPDMSYTDLNQAWLAFRFPFNGIEATVKAGDQRITIHNHRFIGNSSWRQNEQTFGAVTLRNLELFPNTRVGGGYIYKVKSVFNPHGGNDNRDSHSPYATVDFHGIPLHKLFGYYYLFDLDDELANRSNRTYGIRLAAEIPHNSVRWRYSAEYAHQKDYARSSNTFDYDDNYWHLSVGGSVQANAVRYQLDIGWEVLQGRFFTPLATLHSMNGWADRFLGGTADLGLTDLYARFITIWEIDAPFLQEIKLFLRGHHFESEARDLEFGQEIDFELTLKINPNVSFFARHTSYFAESDSGLAVVDRDTHKSWLYGVITF